MRASLLKKLKNVRTTKKQIVVIHPKSGMPTLQGPEERPSNSEEGC